MRLLAVALLVQPRVRIGGRLMRVVGALLAMEVRAAADIGVGIVLGAKALVRSPRLDQGTVDGGVIVRHESLRLLIHRREKLLRHLAVQQPVAVLREHGVVPDRVIHAQADDPTEEQVVVDLLDQLALRTNRMKRLYSSVRSKYSGATDARPMAAYSLGSPQ
jgi:hypothetical protein